MNPDLVAAVSWAAELIVGGALFAAGIAKARDVRGAARAIGDYRLVPTSLAWPAAVAITAGELVAGLGLMIGVSEAYVLGLGLIATFTGAVGSALLRGLDIDCHCAGAKETEKVSGRTLLRNAVLLLALLAAGIWSPASRVTLPMDVTPAPGDLPMALATAAVLTLGALCWSAFAFSTAAERIWRHQ